jgi:hypothetical protein
MIEMAAQSGVVADLRRLALFAGAAVLLALAALCLIIGLSGTLIFGATADNQGGGAAFIPAAIPLLAAGYLILRGVRFARVLGLVVAIVYGTFMAVVATTPLRGVTPPPGQSREPLDPVAVALTVVMFAVALLIVIGAQRSATRES